MILNSVRDSQQSLVMESPIAWCYTIQ